MKRIKIMKQGKEYGFFECEPDQVAAQLAERKVQAWGKDERWVRLEQEDITGAIDSRQVSVFGAPLITEYLLPAQYQIVEEDLTLEIESKKSKDKEEQLNESLRKAAKQAVMDFDMTKVKDADLKTFLTNIKILISKWQ